MILRARRGSTRLEDADRYVDYLRETGVREYRATPGNQGVFLLRRMRPDRAEFLLLSLWDSMDAVPAFAGADSERAVFYPEDDLYLTERDELVEHFDVIEMPPSFQPA